jgi:hypothetical protein
VPERRSAFRFLLPTALPISVCLFTGPHLTCSLKCIELYRQICSWSCLRPFSPPCGFFCGYVCGLISFDALMRQDLSHNYRVPALLQRLYSRYDLLENVCSRSALWSSQGTDCRLIVCEDIDEFPARASISISFYHYQCKLDPLQLCRVHG